MIERRYSEDEVAAIFERATEAQQSGRRVLPAGEGHTLTELQSIGREVGIPAELVAEAARALDRPDSQEPKRFLGLPVGVGRTVELGRRLTDQEWEQLVVDLRETFDARGTVRSDGSFRDWTNGNLQALLEPTPTGEHRLRLRTYRAASRLRMTAGVGMAGLAAAVVGGAAISGHTVPALASVWPLAVIGAALFGLGAARLPGWARLRRRQMDQIADRLAQRLAAGGEPAGLPSGPASDPSDSAR